MCSDLSIVKWWIVLPYKSPFSAPRVDVNPKNPPLYTQKVDANPKKKRPAFPGGNEGEFRVLRLLRLA